MTTEFTIAAVLQQGRLSYEAVLFAASFAAFNSECAARLVFLEPAPGPLWPDASPRADAEIHDFLTSCGAEIIPFSNRLFGAKYPHGNKIEALSALPERPFIFFDTDTLFLGAVDRLALNFATPSASLRREGTWPRIGPETPDHAAIWRALYDRFGLDFATSLDQDFGPDDWRRYLYFNAGFFFAASPREFGALWAEIAGAVWSDPPPELAGQKLTPWLDQITLPLVIHAFGGDRSGGDPVLDGEITCHYRTLPLLYARENDAVVDVLEEIAGRNRIKKILKPYRPFHQMIYRGKGRLVRGLFDGAGLPDCEKEIRKRIRDAGLWMR